MMNKYGYEVICCSKLSQQFIEQLNINFYRNKKLAIQVKNTKYIDKQALLYLKDLKNKYNLDIKVSVIGPYNIDAVDSENTKEKYFYNTLYDIDELYKIISQFEKIESQIDSKWNKFDIIVYLIETIVRNIMYDPEYLLMHIKGLSIPKIIGIQDAADFFDRSLRGMLTRKSVCAGFSVIFKELANRNGIECKYVNGASYSEDGVYRGGHAWNLIKIDDVIYPIDITKKNTKYRNGDFTNIEDISCDIEKFKRTHRPYDKKDNEGLTQLDPNIIKKSKKKIALKKHYNATTYIMQRLDKTKFIVSQIGIYKGLYRYLYAEVNDDGSYGLSTIVFSETNLAKEINDYKFERSNHYDDFIYSFTNVLFSKENINDSKKNKNTKYIGCCELPNKNGYVQRTTEIIKYDRAIKVFSIDYIKSQKRQDGSTVTIVQFPNKTAKNQAYEYFIYVLSKGPNVMEYNIYSNYDYFSMQPKFVVNSILSDSNLQSSIKNNGIIR